MMIKYHKFGLIRFRQCRVHIWLQQCWRRVHKACSPSSLQPLETTWHLSSSWRDVEIFQTCHIGSSSDTVKSAPCCTNICVLPFTQAKLSLSQVCEYYRDESQFDIFQKVLAHFFWRLSYNQTVLVSWTTEGMVMQKYCLSRPIKNKQGNRFIIGIGKSD